MKEELVVKEEEERPQKAKITFEKTISPEETLSYRFNKLWDGKKEEEESPEVLAVPLQRTIIGNGILQ